MTDDSPSNREKKRLVSAELRRLQQKPGWDPTARAARPDPEAQLRALGDTSRRNKTYADSTDCAACAQERQAAADPTALCPDHLAAALGLD